MAAKIQTEKLSAWYGPKKAIEDITLDFEEHAVSAIIGPSGCGKSTLIRCLNRMHETIPKARAEGKVLLNNEDIYALPAVTVRRRIGMVFQKANPFPTMSIYENVAAGLRLNGERDRDRLDAAVLESLKQAALWDEVKDSLDKSGASLSGGQQQRLCIARALAVRPEVLLMDEPCAARDPKGHRLSDPARRRSCARGLHDRSGSLRSPARDRAHVRRPHRPPCARRSGSSDDHDVSEDHDRPGPDRTVRERRRGTHVAIQSVGARCRIRACANPGDGRPNDPDGRHGD